MSLKCPYCGSKDIRKLGYVLTVKYGREQKYQCKSCYHTFISRVHKDKVV